MALAAKSNHKNTAGIFIFIFFFFRFIEELHPLTLKTTVVLNNDGVPFREKRSGGKKKMENVKY